MAVLTDPRSSRDDLPVGMGPMRVRHPVVAALVAVAVGTLGTGFGAGIGVRYLQKTGFTVETVTGLVTLAGGLMLLAYAAVVGWRLLRRWARLLLVPAAVLVLAVAGSLTEACMFAVVPPTALGERTPADLGVAYTDVAFRTSDGATLSAWYLPGSNGAAIVVRHGAGSTRTAALSRAAVLARHGYGVLLVDARGHGRSGGTGNDRGWYGERDTAAAVTFLARQRGVEAERIGVLGLSMGGEEAIAAAGADPRIHAVVAEGATSRSAADKARWLPHGLDGILQRALDRMTDTFTRLLSPAPTPRPLHDAVVDAKGASFLLVSAGTMPDEARAAADLRAVAPARVESWDVARSGHTRGLATDPAGWESRVVAFLDAHLDGT